MKSLFSKLVSFLCSLFRWRRKQLFFIKPYLQLGSRPLSDRCIELLWFAYDGEPKFSVEVQTGTGSYRRCPVTPSERVEIFAQPEHYRYASRLSDLVPGEMFRYRVLHNDVVVFSSEALAPKTSGDFFIAVYGDLADGSEASKRIAHRVYETRPDAIVLAGDIVYSHGRFSEYMSYFWPVYNSDISAPDVGAPILRSIVVAAAAGNHDMSFLKPRDERQREEFKTDLFAFFRFWKQTNNGPRLRANRLLQSGRKKRLKRDLLTQFGEKFASVTNFSFDYGDSHWVILDANTYMDWTDQQLQQWLEKDLIAAGDKQWKFVSFHQPGFNSDRKYHTDQRMRILAPIFERCGVDIVFNGHAHFYERSYPLTFIPFPQWNGALIKPNGEVDGHITPDTTFDGDENRQPKGVIYIVTGAGGKLLTTDHQPIEPRPIFSHKLFTERPSFTTVRQRGKVLEVVQVGDDGSELDHFVISKESAAQESTQVA